MQNTNDFLNPTNTVRFQENNKNKKQASKDKQATSKQTNEQAPLATNHGQRTSKQIPRTNKH